MEYDLITFGETMIRFTPPGTDVIEQSSALNMYPAGSELNVAVAASRLGMSVSYVSRLAENPLGRFVNNRCREQGISTKWMEWSAQDRQGLYFFENGSSPRPGRAYYDREQSAFSRFQPGDIDWQTVLSTTEIFFTSGINPALSDSVHRLTLQAVRQASKMEKKVAFDVNYRSKLWDEKSAKKRLEEYFPYIDILFVSAGDAVEVLGFTQSSGEEMVLEIVDRYRVPTICLISGSEKDNSLWQISCYSETEGDVFQQSQCGQLVTIDRLGAGDAFAGGFLAGYLESGPEFGVQLGNAVMTLTNTYRGDLSWITRKQVEEYLYEKDEMLKR